MDYQDQIIHVTCKVTITTIKQLIRLLPAVYHAIRALRGKEGRIVHGKQSMKKLNLQNLELADVPIPREDLKAVQREFKAYSVDFSVKRGEDGTTHLFFKAQDVDRVYAALTHVVSRNMELSENKEQPKTRLEDAVKQAKMRAETYNQKRSPRRERSHQRRRRQDRDEQAV